MKKKSESNGYTPCLVMGRKMFFRETPDSFIIFNGRKQEVTRVKKDVSPNYVSGVMARRGLTGVQKDACRLGIHLLEKRKK